MWSSEGIGTGDQLTDWPTIKELTAGTNDLGRLFIALADMATGATNLRTGRKQGGTYLADECRNIIVAAKRAGELVGGIVSSDPTTALAQGALAFGFRTVANRATEAERLCRKRKPDWAVTSATVAAVGLTLMAAEPFLYPYLAKPVEAMAQSTES